MKRYSFRSHPRFCHRRLLLSILALWPTGAVLQANPNGGQAVHGKVEIKQDGHKLTIRQADDRAILHWEDFSIAQGEITQFLQPGKNSATLNRVLGGKISEIYGTLDANGKIYLINPNGIVVGPSGVINTAGFVASTLDVTNEEFLAGGDMTFRGNSTAKIINMGKIGATDGDVILIAQEIENIGTISAPNGTASLAAGQEVLVKASGAERVFVQAGKGSVTNSGLIEGAAAEIKAAGGNEYALAINNTGTVRATGVVSSGGKIRLVASGGKIRQAGTLRATKAPLSNERADVRVLGKEVELTETSRIEAPGGFVETSGDRIVIAKGSSVDTRAADGTAGTWLIDPVTLNVVTGGGSDITASTVDPATIVSLLNANNITLQATNSITVSDAINASANVNSNVTTANNLTFDTVTLNLDAAVTLKAGAVLSGSSLLTTVNVGSSGRVQNGIDAVATGGTVNLAATTYNLPGTVNIAKTVTVNGTAGSTVLDAGNAFRVMTISAGAVTLDGLTLQRGSAVSGGGLSIGGGANVTIRNSTITSNRATNNSGAGFFGGGLLTDAGTTILIDRSTISDNTARFGAGMDHYGALTITNSTISGNVASSSGGGVYLNPGSSLNISNSTVANNRANGIGAGLDSDGGTMTINYTTVIGNVAATGGGIFSSGSLTMGHSLVVGNTATSGPDIRVAAGASTSTGYNILGSISGFTPNGTTDVTYTGALANIVQTNSGAAVLADNGGPTKTIALIPGSVAYLGGGANSGGLLDQRGLARGTTVSVGAYDADPTTLSHVVTTTADNLVIGSSQNSLRSAIWAINQGYGSGSAVTFDATGVFATAQTITLTLGELVPSESMSITGSTAGVTVNANNLSRVMRFAGTGADTFTLDLLTLTGGRVSGTSVAGGGIEFVNSGTLNVLNSTISGSQSVNSSGGGIYASGSTLSVTNSTISGNTAFNYGGGIEATNALGLTVLNSTIANNTAQYGGGIDINTTTTTITNSTISGNTANGDSNGGGIFNNSSAVTVTNSIIAGNTATNSPDVSGSFTDGGNNLVGNAAGATGFTVSTLVGTTLAPLNAGLSALGNYGGPTQTFGLLPGSIAINAGSATGNDQRGLGRVGTADIGSFESQGFTYSVAGGSGQQAELAAAFANPLVVGVTANNTAEPVTGGIVNLVLPSSGASATGTLQQTINASGQASFSLTANTTLGTYSAAVQASPTTTFSLENIKISLTVTLDANQGKIYGDSDPTLTYSLTTGSFLPGDGFTGSLVRAAGENVGPYSVGVGTLTAGGNYNVTYLTGGNSFTITQRAITVTAGSGSSIYGDTPTNPGVSVTTGDLKNGDTLTSLGIANDFNLTGTSNAGDYVIKVTGSGGLNYALTTADGLWTIDKRAITVTAGSGSSIYGDTPTNPGVSLTSGDLKNGDTLTSLAIANDFNLTSASNAGDYVIQVTGSGGLNYALTTANGLWTIGKRSITVTAGSGSSIYGDTPTNPGVSLTSGDLKNGDTLTSLGIANNFNLTSASNAGAYIIQVTGSGGLNYTLTTANGQWTIGKRPIAVAVGSGSSIYGDTPTDPGLTVTDGTLVNGDTLASLGLTHEFPITNRTNVGTYTLTPSAATSSNYEIISQGGTWVVKVRPLSLVALAGQGKAFGSSDPILLYTATGLVNGDTLSGLLSRVSGENPGLYKILLGSLSGGTNYLLDFTGANFTIFGAPISQLQSQLIIGSQENVTDLLNGMKTPTPPGGPQGFSYQGGTPPSGVITSGSSYTIGQ